VTLAGFEECDHVGVSKFLILSCTTVTILQCATVESTFSNHKSVRDAKEFGICKLDARAGVAIIEQYVETSLSKLRVKRFTCCTNSV
jgi:hypothetical protein